ncbi:glycosyl hydrolase family 35, partial [Cutibacterium acnes]
ALTSYVRADGITVPLFTNDYSMAGHRPPLTVIQTRSGTPAGRHPLRPIRIP